MKKIVLYILILPILFIVGDRIYVYTGLYKEDISRCNAELIVTLDSSISTKNIIYFGESSNFTFSEKDSIKKSISELIAEKDDQYNILTLVKGGIHAGTYNKLLHHVKNNNSVKLVIISVNLRSFGINWIESTLETNISRASIMYSSYPPVIKKFLLSFKAYDNKDDFKRKEIINYHYKHDLFTLPHKKYTSVLDWDAEVYDKGILDNEGKKDKELTEVACHFIKNYAFTLDEENPRIKDLDAIAAYCREKNIKVIFSLLPENFERARILCGEDLEVLMRANASFIKKRYSQSTIFIDNFAALPDSFFIDRGWPTEHYIYYGRNLVADSINVRIQTSGVKF